MNMDMMQTTTAVLDKAPELPVLDVKKTELASFMRMLVSDWQLREMFATDPAQAIEKSGVSLSPEVADAVIAHAPTLLTATSDVDQTTVNTYIYAWLMPVHRPPPVDPPGLS